MKISELPNGLRELALLRQREYKSYIGESSISSFNWADTEEGSEFWVELHIGSLEILSHPRYSKYIEIYEIY